MKLSNERRQALYKAISGPIMDDRVKLAKCNAWATVAVDRRLFELEQTIWNRVKAALKIEGDE